MAVYAEGMPCWVDVTLDDVEAGKRFYGGLFGWTFEDPGIEERGGGTDWSGRAARVGQTRFVHALSGGKKVAALAAKRDGRMPTAWGVYFATDDAAALTRRIRDAGGQMVTDPQPVPPLGVMAAAADPGGAVFGLWQAGSHAGFEKRDQPGSFCWTEVYARDKNRTDPFYETVFGFQGFDLDLSGEDAAGEGAVGDGQAGEGQAGEGVPGADEAVEDFRTWSPAGADPGPDTAIGGRSVMGDAFPAEMPDHFMVYFVVDDCDTAASKAVDLGGRVQAQPFDTPYGRIAVLTDDQGATFAVLAELPARSAGPAGSAKSAESPESPESAERAELAEPPESGERAGLAESGEVSDRVGPDERQETGK